MSVLTVSKHQRNARSFVGRHLFNDRVFFAIRARNVCAKSTLCQQVIVKW